MYQIKKREQFGPVTFLWEVVAPEVAKSCLPGHFVMVRIDEMGERIPLTVADYDRDNGTVRVVDSGLYWAAWIAFASGTTPQGCPCWWRIRRRAGFPAVAHAQGTGILYRFNHRVSE